jgi:hypothetical protein
MKLPDLSAQNSIRVTIHSQFPLSPEHSHSVVSNAHSKQSKVFGMNVAVKAI